MINLKYINTYSLIFFTLILPFSPALSNIFFAIFCVSSITEYIINRKQSHTIKTTYVSYVFFLLIGYLLVNGLLQGSYLANKTLWKFLPILGIGSLFMLYKKEFSFDSIKKASIISCICFVVLCLIRTVIFYSQNNFIPFANEGEMVDILKIHRPYLGFYVLLNIILSFDLIMNSKLKMYKYIYSSILVFFATFLILITARLSIISFVIIALIYILFYLKLNIFKKVTLGFTSCIAFMLLLSYNPNIQERLNHNNIELLVDHEPRFVIWESINTIRNNEDFNTIIGYGNYNLIEDYLVINYEKSIEKIEKRNYYLNERFNTHSQYFDYFLFGGFPALILFTAFCIISLWMTKRDFTPFAIIVSFILFFSVENVFHRQLGCYLFILYYFLSLKRTEKIVV